MGGHPARPGATSTVASAGASRATSIGALGLTTATAGASLPHGRAQGRDAAERAAPPPEVAPPAADQVPRARGVSYRASLVLWLSLLAVSTGLAVSAIAFRGARAG